MACESPSESPSGAGTFCFSFPLLSNKARILLLITVKEEEVVVGAVPVGGEDLVPAGDGGGGYDTDDPLGLVQSPLHLQGRGRSLGFRV
eukprot:88295-Prorocentrum_minimum.AAC.1